MRESLLTLSNVFVIVTTMKRTLVKAFAVLLLCTYASARRHDGTPPPAPMVVAKPIASAEVSDMLIYPARLVSRVNATLLAESDGVIQAIRKPLGTRVRAGDSVFTLVNPDPVYTYAPFEVEAPVDGVVSNIGVTLGSRVTKGTRLGSITDPFQVHGIIEVTVADLSALSVGMKGKLELSETGQSLPVTIAGISPVIDPATGTASAELKVTDRSKLPPPGLVGRVRFQARLHKGIELPESAVFYRGHQAVVRVLDGDKAVFRNVKLGTSRQGKFEILDGLKSGEVVVLRTNTFIADGEKVTSQPPDKEGT